MHQLDKIKRLDSIKMDGATVEIFDVEIVNFGEYVQFVGEKFSRPTKKS